MRKRFITLLGVVGILCLTLALFAPVANAAEDTDTATVLVTVTASTIAVTAPADWNFGNMGVGETAEQLDAVVNVMANTAYSLEVSGTDFAAVSFPVSYLDWKSGGGVPTPTCPRSMPLSLLTLVASQRLRRATTLTLTCGLPSRPALAVPTAPR